MCGLLAVGGLVAGIVASVGTDFAPAGAGTQITGVSIINGAAWANALFAVALLGVVGVGWWQAQAWDEARGREDDPADEGEALGHIDRAHKICVWGVAALAVTLAGSVALLVGAILEGGPSSDAQSWSQDVVEVANVLAVATMSFAALWAYRKVVLSSAPGSPAPLP